MVNLYMYLILCQNTSLPVPVCGFWDHTADGGQGNWSTVGCQYNGTVQGRVICLCDHLTNFAILTVGISKYMSVLKCKTILCYNSSKNFFLCYFKLDIKHCLTLYRKDFY